MKNDKTHNYLVKHNTIFYIGMIFSTTFV
ncbi:hypothetical protein BOQ62_04795 [Chryseobacterium sp. CH21]|nr:hypothetical protein BOQ62_04795 [Chryseobacterium sp. CH21]